MGYVADWNRKNMKKGETSDSLTVKKYADGGRVSGENADAAFNKQASYDSISDFMNYVRGRGKYDARAMDNPFSESDAPTQAPSPVSEPVTVEPVNQSAPEDGNVGGPRNEEAVKTESKPRATAARVMPRRPAPKAVSRPAVQPIPKTTGASPEEGNVGGPVAPRLNSVPASELKQPASSTSLAMDRASVAKRKEDAPGPGPIERFLLTPRFDPKFKDGGLVTDGNWSRGNYKKSGC
jgi:hypothetical protein